MAPNKNKRHQQKGPNLEKSPKEMQPTEPTQPTLKKQKANRGKTEVKTETTINTSNLL